MKDIMNADEVCKMLKIHKNTLMRLVAKGFPVIKFTSKLYRFEREKIEHWLELQAKQDHEVGES